VCSGKKKRPKTIDFLGGALFPIESLQKAAAAVRANIGQAYAPAVQLINQTHNVEEKLTIQDDRSLASSQAASQEQDADLHTPCLVSMQCSCQ
jgi:hypothetical protein